MKLKETFYFNKDDYRSTIAKKDFSHTDLAKEIYRKRAKKLSAKVRAGVSLAAATVTGGASLLSSAHSARNISVENQKLKLLEEEWRRRGQPELPKSKLKDKIIPITIAAGTSLFTVGIDIALSGASPDQFYQVMPNMDPAVNEYIISHAYYPVVESALGSTGGYVTGKVVTVGRGKEYGSGSSKNKGYSDDEEDDEKYGSSEDDDYYNSDEKDYSDEDEDEEEEDEEEEESDDSESDHGYRSGRRY
ncbi:hypothetical protein BDN70DRAFT_920900 [Pholiota conissans]|uniref:Uncharacterized protein n=1 Tax=Pholiota conissans TaxID=109636 RepID=A0A9P5Z2H6_9AGAR|nr:hypothetical protein BDN70DRAFT_920900 [Pholiota conissans]